MKNPISKDIKPAGFRCLNNTEEKLLIYLMARKNSQIKYGQCFIRKNGYFTSRAQGVFTLNRRGIIDIKRVNSNQIYFQLKPHLQQYFCMNIIKILFN